MRDTALVLILLFGGLPFGAAPRPHIVMLLADDLGWNDVGFHGSEIQTPNVDRLAAAGARLDQYYVQPVCTPTRAAFLTGRYPMRYGLQVGVILAWHDIGLPTKERTLAQTLQAAGYETAIVGKWHLGHHDADQLPTRRGFDHQYGHYLGMIDYFAHTGYHGLDWHRDDRPLREEGYSTTLIGDEAVRRIERHDAGKPLFLYVAFNAPHTPLQVPPEYLRPYEKISNSKRRSFAAMVTCMDEQIGQIRAALAAKGMTANTLLIFSSDNGGAEYGGADNGSLRAAKGDLYEGGVRVPSVAAWSNRIPAGTIIREPIHVCDWYPTLARLAGAKAPTDPPLDGCDIGAVLTEGASTSRREILHNVTQDTGSLRRGKWKLVVNGDHRRNSEQIRAAPVVELFDIIADPGEQKDLSGRHPDLLADLQRRLGKYRQLAANPLRSPSNRRPENWEAPEVWGPSPEVLGH